MNWLDSSLVYLISNLIKLYRLVRPLLERMNQTIFGFSFGCRRTPTCSEYTLLSLKRYGTMLGLLKGLKRWFSCLGFGKEYHAKH